jgi:hypothetical protein
MVYRKEASLLIAVAAVKFMMEVLGKKKKWLESCKQH